MAQAALEDSIRYAKQRWAFGRPIADHQAIQLKLADMATNIEAARLLVHAAAAKKDSGDRSDLEVGMAKLFATEMCQEVALEAMRIHGGYGYIKEMRVERYYRDAPFMLIGEGTSEIQKLVIARTFCASTQRDACCDPERSEGSGAGPPRALFSAERDRPNVGEGLQTLAQNPRRGLKTPTHIVSPGVWGRPRRIDATPFEVW